MIRTHLYDAFISYNRHDSDQVDVLAELLVRAGLSVWLDRQELRPSRLWRTEIEEAINASKAAIVVWGPQALGPVQREERDLAYAVRDAYREFVVVYALLPRARKPMASFANIDTWVQFKGRIDEPDTLALLVAALQNRPPPKPITLPDEPRPYRGLAAFGVDDDSVFFGRASYLKEMLERLAHHPFLAVIGPSGSGKTSVVQAGLLAALRHDVVPGSAAFPQLIVRPGPRPLHALALHLARLSSAVDRFANADDIYRRAQERPESVPEIVQALVEDHRLVLVIDRLEEIYTLCESEAERRPFLEALVALARHPHHPVWVVVTLRADFYDRVGDQSDLTTQLVDHQVYLKPMELENTAEIIEAPAAEVGAIFQQGLATQVRTDAEARGGLVLPLLQHALDLLWREREGRWLTWDAYRKIGGVAGALRYQADRVIAGLSEDERAIARRLLLRMIWVDETTGTLAGRRIDKRDLVESPADEKVLQWLASERLVVLGSEAMRATAELIHDTLPLHWGTLREWMLQDREFLLWRQRLRASLSEWQRIGHDPNDPGAGLLRGKPLVEAERWIAERGADLSPAEEAYIHASVADRERQQAVRAEQRRRIVASLVGGSVLALILVAIAFVQRDAALGQQRIARSQDLQAKAVGSVLADPERSVALVLEALKLQQPENTVDVLRQSLAASYLKRVLEGHTDAVTTVAFSADDRWVVTASRDGTARVWAVDSGASVELAGHSNIVNTAEFSGDGSRVVTASADGTARIWNARSGELQHKLEGHLRNVRVARFNPQGTLVVTASDDNTGRIWDARTGAVMHTITHGERVVDALFSPLDGRWAVTASVDRTANAFDIETEVTARLNGHTDSLTSVSFSANGSHLVTTSRDGTARIWPTSTWTEPRLLERQVGQLNGATFSPNGTLVATRSDDWTIRVWDLTGSGPTTTRFQLRGHAREMNSAEFSRDGAFMLTASRDKTARIWDADPEPTENEDRTLSELRGHTQAVKYAAFSSNGKLVATAGDDWTARIWDATGGQSIARLPHPEEITQATFLNNPERFITWTRREQVARLWSMDTPGHETRLADHADTFVLAPDSRYIVTWWTGAPEERDKPLEPARVWDGLTGASLAELGSKVRSAAFSPDGRRLVTASEAGELSVWSTSTWEHVATLAGNGRRVQGLAFSWDGRQVAAGVRDDGTVRLWEVDNAKVRPISHARNISNVVFHPDGRLVTLAGDRTVRLFRPDAELDWALEHEGMPQLKGISRDGTRLLTLTPSDSSARLWDLSERKAHVLTGKVKDVQFSDDGAYVVTANADSTARVWSARTGQLEHELRGHTHEVDKAIFSRDRRFIATASAEGTVRVWNAQTGSLLLHIRAHGKKINSLSFSPDGRRILTASDDRTARVFACEICAPLDELRRLAAGRPLPDLPPSERATDVSPP